MVLLANDLGVGRLPVSEGQRAFAGAGLDAAAIYGFARFSSSTTGRWIFSCAALSAPSLVAKVSLDRDAALEREIAFYTGAPDDIRGILPDARLSGDFSGTRLVTVAVEASLPVTDPRTIAQVATRLAESDITHGDFAPWNLVRDTADSVYLLDWESWSSGHRPYWDVLHFVYKAEALLGKRDVTAFLEALDSPANPVHFYEGATGLTGRNEALRRYLAESVPEPRGHPAFQFRTALQDRLIR